jgi:zinc and cadmium transporter
MLSTLAIYTFVLVAVALTGISLLRRFELNHTRTQLVMSFVSGIMLGVALFHLLPHALYAAQAQASDKLNVDFVVFWLMLGILGMFLLQRVFSFHQHDFDENYDDAHGHHHGQSSGASNDSSLTGFGVFFGLALHSTIDGVALAAAILIDSSSEHAGFHLAGIGVFIAILLHKPLDAITIDMFARRRDLARGWRRVLVIAYLLICPLSALLVILGFTSFTEEKVGFTIAALSFSSGVFLCIALSDLLPEIHFHHHDRFVMSIALLLGVALAYSIIFIESGVSHHLDFNSVNGHHSHPHSEHDHGVHE